MLTLQALIVVALVLGVYAFLVRILEGSSPRELDVRQLPAIVVGFLLGAVLIGLSLGLISLVASVESSFVGFDLPVFSVLLQALVVGVTEELLFRCALQRVGEDILGKTGALLVSALIFGIAHFQNSGSSVWTSTCVAAGGLLLGLAFLLTRNLWLPAGLHAGWNFAQAGLFGMAVSGTRMPGVLETSLAGSDLVTGGSFGVEASAVTLLVLAGSSAVLVFVLQRRSAGSWGSASMASLSRPNKRIQLTRKR